MGGYETRVTMHAHSPTSARAVRAWWTCHTDETWEVRLSQQPELTIGSLISLG